MVNTNTTTIQIEEKQLQRLMVEKAKYRVPYCKIIEAYQRVIDKFNLHQEIDLIIGEKLRDKLKEK